MARKAKLHLVLISLIAMLFLSLIFPEHRLYPNEDRYLYGFPGTFLTIYGNDFYLNRGIEDMPPIYQRVLFDLLQFIFNVLFVYICLRILIFVRKYIFNKFKKGCTGDVQTL